MAFHLTIDGVDYTQYIVPSVDPIVDDALNLSKELTVAVYPADTSFLSVTEGQRVRLFSDTKVLFTGYVTATPVREIVAEGYSGYLVLAESDEWVFDVDPMGVTEEFVGQFSGDILIKLVELAGGTLDTSIVTQGPFVPRFLVEPTWTFTEAAYNLCQKIGWRWYIVDGVLYFLPQNDKTYGYAIDTTDPDFVAANFTISASNTKQANDATAVGYSEPQGFIADAFGIDQKHFSWDLSNDVYGSIAPTELFNDPLNNSSLDAELWIVKDPFQIIQYFRKDLNILGGSSELGGTYLYSKTAFEMGAELTFNFGTFTFSSLSVGIIGGIYTSANVTQANCFAGFWVSGNTVTSSIQYLVNGVVAGSYNTTQDNHSYELRLHVSVDETYRYNDIFNSTTAQFGGNVIKSGGYLTFEIVDRDLANPAIAPVSTVIYDTYVADIPAFTHLALFNSLGMYADCIVGPKVTQEPPIRVRTTIARLDYSIEQSNDNTYRISVLPSALIGYINGQITARYRTVGIPKARLVDNNAIATLGRKPVTITLPASVRTTQDCENLLQSYLTDHGKTLYEGVYTTPEITLNEIPVTGRFVSVNDANTTPEFVSLVRNVKLHLIELDDETVTVFTAYGFAPVLPVYSVASKQGTITATDIASVPGSIPDDSKFRINFVYGDSFVVDMQRNAQGTYEVRTSDSGWGGGGFISQTSGSTITVPRVARTDVIYIREADGGVTPKYSRNAYVVAAAGVPIITQAPTVASSIVVSDTVLFTVVIGDTTDVAGYEIRDGSNVMVFHTDYHNEQEVASATLTERLTANTQRNFTNYGFYTYNFMGEFSSVRSVTASLAAPAAPVISLSSSVGQTVTLLLSTESRNDIIKEILEVASDIGFSSIVYTHQEDGQFSAHSFSLGAAGTYYARARKSDAIGFGANTVSPFAFTLSASTFVDTSTPAAPTALSITSQEVVKAADGTILINVTLSWTASVSTNVVGYEARFVKNGFSNFSFEDSGNVTSLTILGLILGTSYDFAVRAISSAGTPSAFTSTLTATLDNNSVAPATPTGLATTGGFRLVVLNWNLGVEKDIAYYEIYRSTDNLIFTAFAKAYASWFVDRGDSVFGQLGINVNYFYKIRAVNTSGLASSQTSSASGTTLAVVNNDIVANTINADKLIANSITAGQIQAATITGTEIAANTISTIKLTTTGLDVGGGTNKPGKFQVFDNASNIIGYVGTFSSTYFGGTTYGAWFNNMGIGGTVDDPSIAVTSGGDIILIRGTIKKAANVDGVEYVNLFTTIGVWQMTEGSGTTVRDTGGNGLHGTLEGSPSWVTSPYGTGISFNGTTQDLVVANNTLFNVTNAVTWEVVAKWTAAPGAVGADFFNRENQYKFGIDASKILQFAIQTTAGWVFTTTGVVVPLNQWVHIRFTYDGTSVKTFLNGAWAATTAHPNGGNIAASTSKLRFGAGGDVSASGFRSVQIALARMVSTVLTPADPFYGLNNPSNGNVSGAGSIPPTFNGTLTYSTTTTSITWSWSGLTILRSDGTTTAVPNSSQACTGLTNGTTYFFWPYYDEVTNAVAFVTGGVGSPTIAFTAKTTAQQQQQTLFNRIPLSPTAMTAGTGVGGGGSGGGSGSCVRVGTVVESEFRGKVAIETCVLGERILGPEGWETINRLVVLPHCFWIRVTLEDGEVIVVTPTHPFTMADGTCSQAAELTLNDALIVRTGAKYVRQLELSIEHDFKVLVTCEPTHTFWAGEDEPNILAHNIINLS
jgi:hypothetical protein